MKISLSTCTRTYIRSEIRAPILHLYHLTSIALVPTVHYSVYQLIYYGFGVFGNAIGCIRSYKGKYTKLIRNSLLPGNPITPVITEFFALFYTLRVKKLIYRIHYGANTRTN
jgi:hypothetical protein